jgi:hypothetical protein
MNRSVKPLSVEDGTRYQSVSVPKTDPIHKSWPYAVKDCLRNRYVVLTTGAIQAGAFAEQLNRIGFLEDCA